MHACHAHAATWPLAQVSPIVEDVRARGDDAVRDYTAKFDRVELGAVCVPIQVCVAASCAPFVPAGSSFPVCAVLRQVGRQAAEAGRCGVSQAGLLCM